MVLFCEGEPSAHIFSRTASGAYKTVFDDALRWTAEEYLSEKAGKVQSQGLRLSWETQSGLVAENILDIVQ